MVSGAVVRLSRQAAPLARKPSNTLVSHSAPPSRRANAGPSRRGSPFQVCISNARYSPTGASDGTNAGALRELAEKLRDKLGERSAVLLGCVTGDKAQLAVMVSKPATDRLKAGELVKAVAKIVGGSGGGRPDMAQAGGTETGKLDEAIAAMYGEVERTLGAASAPATAG